MTTMSERNEITDVMELCAILQCLGYGIKSWDAHEITSPEGSAMTVVVNCHSSGMQVVLECPSVVCSCPAAEDNSGFWQVSGFAGGKQHAKEQGSLLLGTLPKSVRESLSKELRDIVLAIKCLNETDQPRRSMAERGNKSASMVEIFNKSASMAEFANKSASLIEIANKSESLLELNKSASMVDLCTPEKRAALLKVDTPTRYRSLDALTSARDDVEPPLRTLQNQYTVPGREDVDKKEKFASMSRRQSTYTICSVGDVTPASVRRRNKTSSPIQAPSNSLLESLMEAERAAEGLCKKLGVAIREYLEDAKNDSSISSMLDVSKISVLKVADSKAQFASSPNLSGISTLREEFSKSKLKRFESASTSNLAPKQALDKDIKSKLRRISPNIFKPKKEPSKADKTSGGKSKLPSLFRPRIVTPVRPKLTPEPSPILSTAASKKKFSHVKSTIPRPAPTKKE